MCSAPLGLESGNITDERMIASSSNSGTTAAMGRLLGASSWCSSQQKVDEYLQVNFAEPFLVSYVATQGGASAGTNCFVTSYGLVHRDTGDNWLIYGGRRKKVILLLMLIIITNLLKII